jgi:excinuclease UvrABC ATPase subunit
VAQFQTAAQMDGEQIVVWHARLRTIFERAFPGKNIQNSRLLINKFVLKLSDSNIRQWTHRANPATYNAAMTAASNEAASQSILAHEAGSGGKGNFAINAFGSGGRRSACHGCGSYNHHIAECTKHRPDRYWTINLEAEVSRKGTEVVADAEED